ncbi:urate hydroxylase PuuD [Pelagibacterium sp. 26DY04]|uniref:urate hydroxylase PuuD n=1 Tax=Pelagibacterium sp. 26DY04 TaxID=2967130 RepID=UPI002814A5AE|nr:urate hydroxylase PuuD [Pelagibacterium sp. 26DY04]WMT86062.1 urate hydroxylase PuuD [Pelagibacterium sp. 26DY04]
MTDFTLFWEWLAFAVRWTHVIVGIAWIGSSFYFIALDLGLRRHDNLPAGVQGEEWQVHGGGFYHINKYMVAPPNLPEHLVWFKWESYTTWLTGFAMLAIVYYAGADLFLIDRTVLDVGAPVAIAISLASLALGWVLYDLLCKSPLGKSQNGLMLVLFVILLAMAWGYTQVFTGRAAFLHMGAFTATIMSANVFFIIIPNQKKIVASMKAGEAPDPALGKQSKQRSVHNNYLTLPVLFFMLSNHYPLAFATQYSWAIAGLIFLIGALIRHFFNTMHATGQRPYWTFALALILFLGTIWLSSYPRTTESALASTAAQAFMADPHFEQVSSAVQGRCAMCHAAQPGYAGVPIAPRDVRLDTPELIAEHAREIYLQAGRSHAMPPGNVSMMTDAERALLVTWYQSVTGEQSL